MWRQWKAFKCRKLAARCVISPWSYRNSVRIQELHEFVLVLQRCRFHFLWQSKRLPLILNHKDIGHLGRYTQVQGTPGETIWLELLLFVPSQISHWTTVPTHICAGQFFSQQERVALLCRATELHQHNTEGVLHPPSVRFSLCLGAQESLVKFFWWFFKNLTLCLIKALISLPCQSKNSLHSCFSTLSSVYKRPYHNFTQLNIGLL